MCKLDLKLVLNFFRCKHALCFGHHAIHKIIPVFIVFIKHFTYFNICFPDLKGKMVAVV